MRRSIMASSIGMIFLASFVAGCGGSSTSTDTTIASGGDVTVPVSTGTEIAVKASDTSATTQTLVAAPVSAPVGDVTFTLTNAGNKTHEMIILKTEDAIDKLVIGADNKVSEAASVGEISETPAGKVVTKTFTLAAGNYILVCNIEKHYAQGMRTAFVVK
jgi:uncharacterized cupredoxin-like copper-binding protein